MIDQRALFEAAVVARLKESGFLEIEIRTECLIRVGDGYQDEVINAGWHYWQAALQSAIASPAAWLRPGDPTAAVQNCPLGAMWISDKDDPRAFPVYVAPPTAAPAMYGPYAYLNGPRSLPEDSWSVEDDPIENNEEYFSIPLFAKIDVTFPVTHGAPDSEAYRAYADELRRDLNTASAPAAFPGHATCPACGGTNRMGPYFPGGLSTVCGNCTPIEPKGCAE